MPMWAHYANNHCGYCIEYELDTSIYGRSDTMIQRKVISYSKKRTPIDACIMEQLRIYEKMKATDFNDPPEVEKENFLNALNNALNKNYYTKHSSWGYEKEFRIIYTAVKHIDLPCGNFKQIDENLDMEMSRQKEFQEKQGVLVDLSEIGLRVITIYAGINCNDKNGKCLNRISNSFGCGNAQKISGLTSGNQYGVALKEILGY